MQIWAAPVPFSGSASSCATTGTGTRNTGVSTVAPDERRVPLVVGVHDERDAGGDQLGPRRLDLDAAVAVLEVERDAVVGARDLAVLDLGLGDRGAEVDVPHRRAPRPCRRSPASHQPQERPLRRPARDLADRRVGLRPVDREPEPAEQVLERLLVLGGELLAELDEVRPADRDGRVVASLERGDVESGS